MSPPTDLLPEGARLGAYAIECALGRGGMGAVYRARSVLTGELRALKVILPSQLDDADARARFVREMRIAASIDHPNVVRVFEPALDGDTLLLPMELVEGMNLRQHLTHPLGGVRRIPAAEAVPLLRAVCEGVAAVHARGVIHRDLKPANVMVVRSPDGTTVPKVLDFGAARSARDDDGHTAAGLAIGTPQYMSPEQLRAAPDLDARSDIYALGVIAYELLTARRPYEGHAEEIMALVFTRAPFPAPRALVPTLPPALDAAILRALAYDREDRFADATSLRDALTEALASRDDPRSMELAVERPAPPPRRAAGRALALGAVALALLFGTIALSRHPRRTAAARPAVTVDAARVEPAPAPPEAPVAQPLAVVATDLPDAAVVAPARPARRSGPRPARRPRGAILPRGL